MSENTMMVLMAAIAAAFATAFCLIASDCSQARFEIERQCIEARGTFVNGTCIPK